MKAHHNILIIGGGTAGIMTASQLRKRVSNTTLAIIEPADVHYYQPAWTLVGAGTYDFEKTAKPMEEMIPEGVTWVKDYATAILPERNLVSTKSHGDLSYDILVVATGLVMYPEAIEGLKEALNTGKVCSNYTDPKHTWQVLKNFKGGNAVFTQPEGAIKCGGAPQKMAYLAADYIRKHHLASKSNVAFITPGTTIFGVKQIRETLERVIKRYDMKFRPFMSPVKVDGPGQKIYFSWKDPNLATPPAEVYEPLGGRITSEGLIEIPFELLHLAPPQRAPEFIRKSSIANAEGWVEVDKHSLQHHKYPNIFSLGDVAGLPTAKTGAAIRKQVPVVVDNISKVLLSEKADNKGYNGYSSCPLITGYGKMVLAEFDYDGNFTPDPKLKQMLVFDSSKEHWRLWMLKKYMLPYLYWNKMMKGEEV